MDENEAESGILFYSALFRKSARGEQRIATAYLVTFPRPRPRTKYMFQFQRDCGATVDPVAGVKYN